MHGHIPQQLTVVIGAGPRLPGTPSLNEGKRKDSIIYISGCSVTFLVSGGKNLSSPQGVYIMYLGGKILTATRDRS